jgi:hypothetical protein
MLPPRELTHTLTVSYTNYAGSATTLTQTILLDLPPRGTAVYSDYTELTATVVLSATDSHPPIEMQLSTDPVFEDIPWAAFEPVVRWRWHRATANAAPGALPTLYVRFRDANGNTTAAQRVAPPTQPVYLPLVQR